MLERAGLHRPELRAWAMYDWANSAFYTTIVAAVFPIYYQRVAAATLPPAEATARFAWATAIAVTVVALVTPVLGAMADHAAAKKKMLAAFLGLGVAATAAMAFVGRGDWLLALSLFVAGNIGVAGSLVFYESLLPHIASGPELDRVSTAGYALGYLGGGLLLALNLAAIRRPEWFGLPDAQAATRLSFASVAVWWLLFSLPLFRRVAEPACATGDPDGEGWMASAFRRLGRTFRDVRRHRHAFWFLLAFFVYNDGIQTIIRMAAIYGAEIGLRDEAMIAALLVTQFVGVPCAIAFGLLARPLGPKTAVLAGLAVYVLVTLQAYGMRTEHQFFLLAVLVGMVQGGTQALSRSLFASMIPRHKSAEFFAFFGAVERYAGVLGPVLFGTLVAQTGSSRQAILSVLVFFVVGGAMLAVVDVGAGRRAARDAEARAAEG